jgi:hypothetical protein
MFDAMLYFASGLLTAVVLFWCAAAYMSIPVESESLDEEA